MKSRTQIKKEESEFVIFPTVLKNYHYTNLRIILHSVLVEQLYWFWSKQVKINNLALRLRRVEYFATWFYVFLLGNGRWQSQLNIN